MAELTAVNYEVLAVEEINNVGLSVRRKLTRSGCFVGAAVGFAVTGCAIFGLKSEGFKGTSPDGVKFEENYRASRALFGSSMFDAIKNNFKNQIKESLTFGSSGDKGCTNCNAIRTSNQCASQKKSSPRGACYEDMCDKGKLFLWDRLELVKRFKGFGKKRKRVGKCLQECPLRMIPKRNATTDREECVCIEGYKTYERNDVCEKHGVKYGEKCDGNFERCAAGFECLGPRTNDRKCQCPKNFVYDEKANECKCRTNFILDEEKNECKECAWEGKFIHDFYPKQVTHLAAGNMDECAEACEKSVMFWCRSWGYNKEKTNNDPNCFISSLTLEEAQEAEIGTQKRLGRKREGWTIGKERGWHSQDTKCNTDVAPPSVPKSEPTPSPKQEVPWCPGSERKSVDWPSECGMKSKSIVYQPECHESQCRFMARCGRRFKCKAKAKACTSVKGRVVKNGVHADHTDEESKEHCSNKCTGNNECMAWGWRAKRGGVRCMMSRITIEQANEKRNAWRKSKWTAKWIVTNKCVIKVTRPALISPITQPIAL